MNTRKLILLFSILISINLSVSAWTSSNEGVCYTMDALVLLSVTNKLKKDRILIGNFAAKKMEYPPQIKPICFLSTHKFNLKKPIEFNLSNVP